MKRAFLLSALAVVMLMSVAVFATATTATYENVIGENNTSGDVTVSATVKPKITLTIVTPEVGQTVAFDDVYPGDSLNASVGLSVDSNKSFAITGADDFSATGLTLTRTLMSDTSAKGQNVPFTDAYTLDATWDADPGVYTGTVTYTVTQD